MGTFTSYPASPTALPAVDHEAFGPISLAVRFLAWATQGWAHAAETARAELIRDGRRWL